MKTEQERTCIAIDLKSFYASAECVERGLDPLSTNLVVADESRTEKTICLAVSPALKAYGIPGRARLFEVVQAVERINADRRRRAPGGVFTGKSINAQELADHPEWALDYIAAMPRMSYYMQYSTMVYRVYLRYFAPEDIHVYSIDEVFIEATAYLKTYQTDGPGLARRVMKDILEETGITATAGVGTNLYLAKIAMDIVAKHMQPDENGSRIASLNELTYRETLWDHRPLTDFWRVGRGYAAKLEKNGMYTMGDVARCSLGSPSDYLNEDLLYKLFGINAELLIDHAWGWEPCTIPEIKAYRPESNSISSGQVLHCPYDHAGAALIVREMADQLSLQLTEKQLVTDQLTLTIGYDIENLQDEGLAGQYKGRIRTDYYGRRVPEHAHGTVHLSRFTASTKEITGKTMKLYERVTDPKLLIRRINITAEHVRQETESDDCPAEEEQYSLFEDNREQKRQREAEEKERAREKRLQKAEILIRQKYGANALLKGMNLQEGATMRDRNGQIGGHKA